MTAAMEALFNYAQDCLERPMLLLEPEYENILHSINSQEQRLRAMLSDEAKQLLDDLTDEQNLMLSMEAEVMFRAGFQIAMELSRP